MRDQIMHELMVSEDSCKSPLLNETGVEYYKQEQAYLKEALARLENLPRKATTPKNYHCLFTKAERQANYPLIFKPSEGEPQ
jgi:hypothetical protein